MMKTEGRNRACARTDSTVQAKQLQDTASVPSLCDAPHSDDSHVAHPSDAISSAADANLDRTSLDSVSANSSAAPDAGSTRYVNANSFVVERAYDSLSGAPIASLTHEEITERAIVQSTWLKMTLDQTDDTYWDYNIRTKQFTVFYFDRSGKTSHRTIENFPQSYIEQGRVHADSIDGFRTFFERIGDGPAEGTGNFVLTDRATGFYVWAMLSYLIMVGEDGTPEHAVGIRRNHARQSKGFDGVRAHDPIPETTFPHLHAYLQSNLDQNTVEYLLYEGMERTQTFEETTYDRAVERIVQGAFDASGSVALSSLLSRDNLITHFENGRRWAHATARVADESGAIFWLLISVNMHFGSDTGNVTSYTFMSTLDDRLGWEALLDQTPVINEETGIYDIETGTALARKILATATVNTPCAVTVIDILGMDELAREDADAARRLHDDVAIALNALLDTDCIVWEAGAGSFVVFIPQTMPGSAVQHRLESALFSVRVGFSRSASIDRVRFVAGTICGDALEIDLGEALRQARRICDEHSGATSDTVVLPTAFRLDDASNRSDTGIYAEHFVKTSLAVNWTRDDTLFHAECLEAMVRAAAPGQAINDALGKIGAHHDADRVYVLTTTDDDRIVTVLFEWTSDGRASIQRPFTGRPVDRFPLIKRYLDATETVLVSKPGTHASRNSSEPWRFAIVPVKNATDLTMVICIENPRKHLSNWAVTETVAPFILSEWYKLSRTATSPANDKVALFDRHPDTIALENTLAAYTANRPSSMGALVIDIPDVPILVSKTNLTVVLDVLVEIEKAVSDAFERELIFRTGDAEVTALCPNNTYDAFIRHCATVRTALVASSRGLFRLGCAWSDGAFDSRQIVQEAHRIMLRDDGEAPYRTDDPVALGSAPQIALPFTHSFSEKLGVFLQPKIDVRTGELVGAEALARVFDENGDAVPPAAAIERMEQSGEINNLDFFVFDRTLSILNGWREKGLRAVPVSSNFSRSTLLAPSALASVLAIMSHYPAVSPDMVEMEITETAYDLGSSTLTRIVKQFQDNGLRVALDDFGSHYSNASILSNVHFDTVKIDRAITCGLPNNDVSRMLVRNITDICASQHMECVAEGIETKDQAQALAEEGCYRCQGFYYDKPMPAAAFERKYLSLA